MNIPFFKNYWSQKDIKYVNKVIKRGTHWANGPEIEQLEQKIAHYIGTKYAVTFNSGTSALFGILASLGVKDKEVIVPSFTFIATANVVLHAEGKPVFADIEKTTFGLDPVDVEQKITSKTVAIMPIHYAGIPCNIVEIKKIADKHNIHVIEDAAESLGAKYRQKRVGSMGLAGMFSFTPTKIISTGEGGIVTTGSKKLFEELKLFRSHGRLETENYFETIKYLDYIKLGYGMRMPSICAAQGLAQFENLDLIISKRKKIAQRYNQKLASIKNVKLPHISTDSEAIFQMYSILVKPGRTMRNKLQKYLKAKGIVTKVYFEPIHKTYFYDKVLKIKADLPITEKCSAQVLSLPIYPDLELVEQEYIINTIKKFFTCL